MLALSDGLAGLVGQKIGRRSYQVTGHKTVEGSLTFFIITFLILLTLLHHHPNSIGLSPLLTISLSALLLTIAEGLLGNGWDNLSVPFLGGLIIYYLI